MASTTIPRASESDGDHQARSTPIEESAHAERKRRTDERREEVDLRIRDAGQAKIRQQRFGDEAQALCAAGKGAHHRKRGDADDHPAVVEAPGDLKGGRVLSHAVQFAGAASSGVFVAEPCARRRYYQCYKSHDPGPAVGKNHCAVDDDEEDEPADGKLEHSRPGSVRSRRDPPPRRVAKPDDQEQVIDVDSARKLDAGERRGLPRRLGPRRVVAAAVDHHKGGHRVESASKAPTLHNTRDRQASPAAQQRTAAAMV